MRLVVAILALALPSAIAAQDIAADYATAFDVFSTGPDARDLETMAETIATIVPTLEGRWFPIGIVAGDRRDFDPAFTERACEAVVYDLVTTGLYSFDLLRRTGDDKPSLAIRHSYLGYNRYQRAVDEGDYLAFLGMDDAERQPVLALISNAWNARVAMYHPQPTILVFVGETGGPEFFARCP